ncbi:MAG: hypothetical protein U0794_22260 [Isosphaeraceae bacterium]
MALDPATSSIRPGGAAPIDPNSGVVSVANAALLASRPMRSWSRPATARENIDGPLRSRSIPIVGHLRLESHDRWGGLVKRAAGSSPLKDNLDGLPDASDTVIFNGTSTRTSVIDLNVSLAALQIEASYTGQVNLGSNSLTTYAEQASPRQGASMQPMASWFSPRARR